MLKRSGSEADEEGSGWRRGKRRGVWGATKWETFFLGRIISIESVSIRLKIIATCTAKQNQRCTKLPYAII